MWNLFLIHIIHMPEPGAIAQQRLELLQRARSASGDDLHPPVWQVAGPARQPQPLGVAQHEPAESYPLHPPRDQPASGSRVQLAQGNSPAPAWGVPPRRRCLTMYTAITTPRSGRRASVAIET